MVGKVYREKGSMDGEVHSIEDIDEYIVFALCFPKEECREVYERARKLLSIGIYYLVEDGVDVLGYRVLGKGYSSIVVKALDEDRKVYAVKIRRLDSRRSSLELEGMILDYLYPLEFVPRVYSWSRDFIVMEYIECPGIIDYMVMKNITEGDRLLIEVFRSLYLLDLYDVDHGELNRPYNHVYVCPDGLRIIDWESSRFKDKTHNLTMFASYIFIRSGMYNLTSSEKKKLLEILRIYKNDKTTGFKLLLDFLRSHKVSTSTNAAK